MSVAETQTAVPKPKLRWYQFSMRGLMIFVTLFAVACSGFSWYWRSVRREQAAVAEIEKLGGEVIWTDPSGPVWLRRLLGDDAFRSVDLAALSSTQVTDAGLEHLKGLSQLQVLLLNGTQVTDAGLEHLKGLSQLQVMWLENTQLTDAGLEHINGLNQLRDLRLSNTQVTDAGLEHLQGLSQLQVVWLENTQLTDAGLEHLKGMSQLQYFYLNGTQVTDAGVKKLQQALPNCKIEWKPPTPDERQSPAKPD